MSGGSLQEVEAPAALGGREMICNVSILLSVCFLPFTSAMWSDPAVFPRGWGPGPGYDGSSQLYHPLSV